MSTQTKRKANEERFTYSWYLPVTGSKGSGGSQANVLLEKETDSAAKDEAAVESTPNLVQTIEQPEILALGRRVVPGTRLSVSPFKLRLVALPSWTAVAGVGMALLITQSPIPMNSVLALGGVWATISALVWYLPAKLMR